MHTIMELPPWDRLLKRIIWEHLGEITGKKFRCSSRTIGASFVFAILLFHAFPDFAVNPRK